MSVCVSRIWLTFGQNIVMKIKSLIISWTADYILHKLTKVMRAGLHQGLQPVKLLSEI